MASGGHYFNPLHRLLKRRKALSRLLRASACGLYQAGGLWREASPRHDRAAKSLRI